MIDIAYYPGCSQKGMAGEYDRSSRIVCRHLGINLMEIEGWNCCGATSAHSLNHSLDVSLSARNLDLVREMNLDHVTSPCPGCFSRMKGSWFEMKNNPAVRKKVEEILGKSAPVEPEISSLLQLLATKKSIGEIAQSVVRPLTGLKVAVYYGCLLTRPKQLTEFDDPEQPMSLDRIMSSLGAEPVMWGCKAECCGGGYSVSETDIVLDLSSRILRLAYQSGAEAVVVACPLCQINLDTRQEAIFKKEGIACRLPVIYFTQLMGLAFGYRSSEMGFRRLFVNPIPLLRSKGLV